MNFTLLLVPETMVVVLLCLLIGTLIGFGLGQTLQGRRGEEALARASQMHARSIADLEADHADYLQQLRHGQSEELRRLREQQAHDLEELRDSTAASLQEQERLHAEARIASDAVQEQTILRLKDEHHRLVEQLTTAQVTQLRDLREEHRVALATLQERCSEDLRNSKEEQARTLHALQTQQQQTLENVRKDHEAHVRALREEHHATFQQWKQEHSAALATLRQEQATAVQDLKQEHHETRLRLEAEHAHRYEELQLQQDRHTQTLQTRIASLEAQAVQLGNEKQHLQEALHDLNESVRDDRRNHSFSLSKSGERLIRVIRSVQDLAQEMEETSRTISDGEYSFFASIQEQRDRENILRLTGVEAQGAPASDKPQPSLHVEKEPDALWTSKGEGNP
jgi:hypothetical protein